MKDILLVTIKKACLPLFFILWITFGFGQTTLFELPKIDWLITDSDSVEAYRLEMWNSKLIAYNHRWDNGKFQMVDLANKKFEPLNVYGREYNLIAIAENSTKAFVLGRGNSSMELYESDKENTHWSRTKLPFQYEDQSDYHMVADDVKMVIISTNYIHIKYLDAEWVTKELPLVLHNLGKRSVILFQNNYFPTQVEMIGNMLFMRYYHPDVKGLLVRMRLADHSAHFSELTTLLQDKYIRYMKSDEQTLWIGVGSCTLHTENWAVYKYENKMGLPELQPVQPAINCGNAFVINNQTLIIASDKSVFECKKDGFYELLSGNLEIRDKKVGGINLPESMVKDGMGNIIMAYRNAGILAYMKKDKGYELVQIVN